MRILTQREQYAYRIAQEAPGLPPQPSQPTGPPMGAPAGPAPMSAEEKAAQLPHWQHTVNALRDIGGRWRDEPVPLKDGRTTNIYLDPKNVFSSGRHMNNVGKAMLEHAQALGIDYNAVGGPTMGADVIGHSMVAHSENPDLGWYTVRDKAKSHGLGKWIEGTEIGPNHNVILTDDVADSGKSLVEAYHKIRESGANVAAVMPVVERGDKTAQQFQALGVPYHPLIHYNDLGISSLNPNTAPGPGHGAGDRER